MTGRSAVPSGRPESDAVAARPGFWTAKIIGLLVVAGLVIAGIGGVIGGVIVNAFHGSSSSASPTGLASGSTSPGSCDSAQLARTVLPSVVTIAVTGPQGASNGTGSIIRSDGYILTNYHVVGPAAGGAMTVLFASGKTLPAKLVGQAPKLDLAVIKVDAGQQLPAIGSGDSTGLAVGQPVVALGAPLGLTGSVTSGIVSALGRQISVPTGTGTTAVLSDAIQTDAAINPGNSGGPLVDCQGKQVGVNTAIATVPNASGEAGGGSVGIGFAVPFDLASRVADELISTGTFSGPSFGMSVLPIPPALAEKLGGTPGLFVRVVDEGGPAAAAGIEVGDIITSVGGQAASSADALFHATVTKKPGDKVAIAFLRDGQPHTVDVTLGPS